MVIYLLTALFLGGFANTYPADGRRSGTWCSTMLNMLSYWYYLARRPGAGLDLFVPGRDPPAPLDAIYPPQAILSGTPAGLGHRSYAGLPDPVHHRLTMGGLNYVVTVLGQARTRRMKLMRLRDGVGHFTATVMALLAFPRCSLPR